MCCQGWYHRCCRAGTRKLWPRLISRWVPDSEMHRLGSDAGKQWAGSFTGAGHGRREWDPSDASVLNGVWCVWDTILHRSILVTCSGYSSYKYDPFMTLCLWNTRGLSETLVSVEKSISRSLLCIPFQWLTCKHLTLSVLGADIVWKTCSQLQKV